MAGEDERKNEKRDLFIWFVGVCLILAYGVVMFQFGADYGCDVTDLHYRKSMREMDERTRNLETASGNTHNPQNPQRPDAKSGMEP